MERQREILQKKIARLEAELEQAPEGTLTSSKIRGHWRYYAQIRKKGKRTRRYIKDEGLKAQLAIKKLRMALLRDFRNDLEATEAYLKKRKEYSTADIFENESMRELFSKIYAEWQNAKYEANPYYREQLTVEGAGGVYVRSKSEGDITWGLADEGLPNRYEQKLVLDGKTVYPDFTIFHPMTGKVIIWEHFGLMDDETYARRAYEKIALYIKNGYFPGDNLILTFEDKDHPLSNRTIRETIRFYFGDWLDRKT